jgi:hypothetical protein
MRDSSCNIIIKKQKGKRTETSNFYIQASACPGYSIAYHICTNYWILIVQLEMFEKAYSCNAHAYGVFAFGRNRQKIIYGKNVIAVWEPIAVCILIARRYLAFHCLNGAYLIIVNILWLFLFPKHIIATLNFSYISSIFSLNLLHFFQIN